MVAKVYGIDATIRELKNVEPESIKHLRSDLRSAAEPIALTIRAALPTSAPIRGMRHKGRTAWNISKIKVKAKTNFSRKAATRGYGIVSIWVGGKKGTPGTAALQMADMAGRGRGFKTPSGRAMISALKDAPSRYVWKKAEQQIPKISQEMLLSLESTSKKINRNLVVKDR